MQVCRHESLLLERFTMMKAARTHFEMQCVEHAEQYEAACSALNEIGDVVRTYHEDQDVAAQVDNVDAILDDFNHRD